ncbi:hypothetical protein [Castellaniella sp.]|jgi:hypothetical protein
MEDDGCVGEKGGRGRKKTIDAQQVDALLRGRHNFQLFFDAWQRPED